jgi:phenylacetate-CoA ligase
MSPWLVRNVIYRAHERLIGRPTYRVFGALMASQWWSVQELARLQEWKLRVLLQHAWDHCPSHRRRLVAAGLARGDLERFPLAQIAALPQLDKPTICENLDQLVDRTARGGAFRYTTGGSSGEPLIFYVDRRRQAHDQAARMRTHAWFGVLPGEKEVYLWGAPVELSKQDRIKAMRDRLTNQLLLNAFDMSQESMARYLESIGRYRPACLFGYPSSLALLAEFARTRGQCARFTGLKAVFVTGELLYPHQRQVIEQVFGVPVANCLGARDAGFLAHECPEGGLHVTAESVIVETIDRAGRPARAGELGEIVVTHLENHALPFVRYRTGDMGRLDSGTCRCGRGLPLLQIAEGRSTDFLVRADGTVVHALALIYTLRDLPGVRAFKVHQRSFDHIVVRLVKAAAYVSENESRIVHEFRARLGAGIRVDIVAVDALPPERSGKFRYVTSDVDWRVPTYGHTAVSDRSAVAAG